MTAVDYRILYRQQVDEAELARLSSEWALFISAFNTSDRVTLVYDACHAAAKHWIVHSEYGFETGDLPQQAFTPESRNEAEFWQEYLALSEVDLSAGTVCIDATGFMRPHLAFLMALLFDRGVERFLVVYSDPVRYVRQENTQFSKGPVTEVRQVSGFEGQHNPATPNDLLIVGAGYDDELISRVAEDKANARKLQLFGLPSLELDMYQQSVIRAEAAAEAIGGLSEADTLFAPANDPFVTAQVLHDRVERENGKEEISNLYLASLGTKPQMLGFALYYLTERCGTATSMVFPYADLYAQETTQGLARSWLYTVERLSPP